MLDLLTTLAFLLHGVQEANPVVRFALRYSSHPWGGLLLVKMLALAWASTAGAADAKGC